MAKDLTPSQETWKDTAHQVGRTVFSMVPGLGGPAVELFNTIIAPPIQRRRDEWMAEVAEALRRLEETKGINLEDLRDNETFIDTVFQASRAAIATSQQDKREALRNAVLNATLPEAPEASVQQMFINLIDRLTVWHLRILRLMQDPNQWFREHQTEQGRWRSGGGLGDVLTTAYPELQGRRSFYDQLWRDLYANGLLSTDEVSLHSLSGSGAMASRTTELGNEFLAFITSPLKAETEGDQRFDDDNA